MINPTTDLIIGMLTIAVMVLAYSTIHLYLSSRSKKKCHDELFTAYLNKIIEYNALHERHDLLAKRYGEMAKERDNETK